MTIRTNYRTMPADSFPITGIAVVTEADFKTSQVIVVDGPKDRSWSLNKIGLISTVAAEVSNGATVVVSERDYVNGTKASLTTTMTGSNNDVVFTARQGGIPGNNISVTLVAQNAPNQPLSVQVSGDEITVSLASGPGTAQVETATVAGTITQSGVVNVTVTSAIMPGSPMVVPVEVVNTDTATIVAGRIRSVLAANPTITNYFTVGGSSTGVSLTVKVPRANDTTLNIATANGTSTGLTAAANSANTTAGIAPAITTTASQLLAGLDASIPARTKISGALSGGDTGAGVVTELAKTNLSGGLAYATVQTVVSSVDLADSDSIGKVQSLSIAGSASPIKPGNAIAISITAGTASLDRKDIIVEGVAY